MRIRIKHHYEIEYFDSFTLNLIHNSVASSFDFDFYFDPSNPIHKDVFNPTHFHSVEIFEGKEKLLTGTLLSTSFNSSSSKELSGASGYSLPGVLEDCQIPVELYPLQSDQKTLKEIIEHFISKFGFGLVISDSVKDLADEVYDTTTADASQPIKEYLSSLCSQKNIILSHTSNGNLLLTRANSFGRNLYNFKKNDTAVLNMSLAFNGQPMHSDITTQKQASIDTENAGESSLKNPFVPYTFRPLVKIQTSGTDNDTDKVAKNLRSKELANITISIKLNTWYLNNQFIKPNNIITIQNDEIFIYKTTRFFIESISYTQTKDTTEAVLTCVLPQVYNDSEPSNFFELH